MIRSRSGYSCGKPALTGLAVIVAVVTLHARSSQGLQPLQPGNIQYLGAFRVPHGDFGSGTESGFSFGGGPLGYNPANNSLFIGGTASSNIIAEISIPDPVWSEDVSDLPFATMLQGFADPTEGGVWSQDFGDGVFLGGLLVYSGRLFGTVRTYYDVLAAQTASHYSRSLNLAEPSATPLMQVGDPTWMMGWVAGWLAAVPNEWQAALHGPAITGQCCTTIINRTSLGPSAFWWDPAQLGLQNPVPALPLVGYPIDHPTLGAWDSSSPIYGGTTQIGGVALISGTSTALFVGSNGTGRFCYGHGTDDPSLDGQDAGDGSVYCYDPTNFDKGQHAFPYNMQFWADDLNDLAAVAAGTRQFYEIVPYGVWPFDVPEGGSTVIGGVAYDPDHQLVYVSQFKGDPDGFDFRPLIHVFHVVQ
jgi:hypothetical protein